MRGMRSCILPPRAAAAPTLEVLEVDILWPRWVARIGADWLPVRIALRGANAATRAHVARVRARDKTRREEKEK